MLNVHYSSKTKLNWNFDTLSWWLLVEDFLLADDNRMLLEKIPVTAKNDYGLEI